MLAERHADLRSILIRPSARMQTDPIGEQWRLEYEQINQILQAEMVRMLKPMEGWDSYHNRWTFGPFLDLHVRQPTWQPKQGTLAKCGSLSNEIGPPCKGAQEVTTENNNRTKKKQLHLNQPTNIFLVNSCKFQSWFTFWRSFCRFHVLRITH